MEVEEKEEEETSITLMTFNEVALLGNDSSIEDENSSVDNSITVNPLLTTYLDDIERPRTWIDKELVCYKYVDDFLGAEKIFTGTGILTISQKKTTSEVRAVKSELFYKTVEGNAKEIGLSININKTQMLCVSAALHTNVSTYIKVDTEIIKSQTSLKILGFNFGEQPTAAEHLKSISVKFRRRIWVLRHLKKAEIPEKDLVKLYLALVLPVVDYTCVVYHSMLTKTQELELENLQKLALKVIYGVYVLPYTTLLERSGLVTLANRRVRLIDKFLQKAINHPLYAHWFPIKNFVHYDLRSERVYEELYARTSRLYNSPLYYYRRRLNDTGMLPTST